MAIAHSPSSGYEGSTLRLATRPQKTRKTDETAMQDKEGWGGGVAERG